MKILKTLSLSLALTAGMLQASGPAVVPAAAVYSEIPAKTVVIKHPMANDAAKFFSTGTVFNFEVYKAGSKDEVTKILASLRNDPAVENVSQGALTGDYLAFTITLKSAKNKDWFAIEFKKAGLNTIRLNNNPIVEVEKM